MNMNLYPTFILTIQFIYLLDSVVSQHARLTWVPGKLTEPFVTLMNDISYPNWKTKNSFTRRKAYIPTTYIPAGVPFAVACGACLRYSPENANLTISVPGMATSSNMISGKKGNQIMSNGKRCFIAYMLTQPIKQNGRVECRLKLENSIVKETNYFYLQHSPTIKQTNNLQEVKMDDVMTCPDIPKEHLHSRKANYIFRVWHEDPPTEKFPIIITASMNNELKVKDIINIKQVTDSFVSCSIYNIEKPSMVWKSRYKISRKILMSSNLRHSGYDDLSEGGNSQSSRITMPWPVIGIIIGCVAGTIVLLIIGVHKFVFTRSKAENLDDKLKLHSGQIHRITNVNNALDICRDIPLEDRPPADIAELFSKNNPKSSYIDHTKPIVHQSPLMQDDDDDVFINDQISQSSIDRLNAGSYATINTRSKSRRSFTLNTSLPENDIRLSSFNTKHNANESKNKVKEVLNRNLAASSSLSRRDYHDNIQFYYNQPREMLLNQTSSLQRTNIRRTNT